jgi:hypothetical protein
MRTWLIGVSLVCLLTQISCHKVEMGRSSTAAIPVAFSDLLQRPRDYAGKLVRVSGFLRVEFEGKCIYSSEAAFVRGGYDVSLWVDVPLSMKDFDFEMVVLEGTFDPDSHGHLGLWRKGSLLGVSYLGLQKKEPNQSPEPTVMSVTPAADAPVVPATTVAHL